MKFLIFLVAFWFVGWVISKSKGGKKQSSVPVFYDDTQRDQSPEENHGEEAHRHLKAMRTAIETLLEEHKDLIDCLIYIGKADGRLSDQELEVIAGNLQ